MGRHILSVEQRMGGKRVEGRLAKKNAHILSDSPHSLINYFLWEFSFFSPFNSFCIFRLIYHMQKTTAGWKESFLLFSSACHRMHKKPFNFSLFNLCLMRFNFSRLACGDCGTKFVSKSLFAAHNADKLWKNKRKSVSFINFHWIVL